MKSLSTFSLYVGLFYRIQDERHHKILQAFEENREESRWRYLFCQFHRKVDWRKWNGELFHQLTPPSRIPALPSSPQTSDADDEISIEPSTTSNMSETTTCDTHSQIPTIHELLLRKEEWMRSDVDIESSTKLSRSKEAAKKKKWDPKWLKTYPWLCPIKDGRKVIGVVCELCRELGRQGKSSRAIEQSSGGVWVTKPFTNFGKLTEKAKWRKNSNFSNR